MISLHRNVRLVGQGHKGPNGWKKLPIAHFIFSPFEDLKKVILTGLGRRSRFFLCFQRRGRPAFAAACCSLRAVCSSCFFVFCSFCALSGAFVPNGNGSRIEPAARQLARREARGVRQTDIMATDAGRLDWMHAHIGLCS